MAVKRVVISAAGKGTRMKHLSQDRPKHMIEVNGKPFLFYLLDNLERAGFEEIIVVVGHMREHIEKYISQGHHKNVLIVDQFARMGEDKYGTAMPVLAAEPELKGEPFVFVYGDNLYSVRDLQKFIIDDEWNYIAGLRHETPQHYGVLMFDKDMTLTEIIEKPQQDVGSNIINTGLIKFTPDIFEALRHVQPNPIKGEYYLTDAITEQAAKGKMKVKIIEDYWLDFGKPDDVRILAEFLTKEANLVQQ